MVERYPRPGGDESGEVQVYESILGAPGGRVTTVFARASRPDHDGRDPGIRE